MSARVPSITLQEVRAAQAVIRGEPVDAADFSQLLGVTRPIAELLLQPGVPTWARERAVLPHVVSRLRGSDTTPDEIDEAITVRWRLMRNEALSPAPDLTMEEIRAAEDLLRGQDADIGAASAFLGCSPADVLRLLFVACDSRALDGLLIATLLLRLHGRRVGVAQTRDALLAVIQREAAALGRAAAH